MRSTVPGATTSTRRPGARDGARAMAPIALGLVPLAVSIGAAASHTGAGGAAGLASGPLLFTGAAQLSALTMLGAGASAGAVVGTVILLNARMALYSAGLAPALARQPRWFRAAAAYFVVDPIVATSAGALRGADPAGARRHYLGAAAVLWVAWVGGIGAGVLAGPVIDPAWSLDALGPICLAALLGPKLRDGTARVPALVAALVATAALPSAPGVAVPVAMLAAVVLAARTAGGR